MSAGRGAKLALYVGACGATGLLVLPIAWGAMMSFAPHGYALRGIFPERWTLSNYTGILGQGGFWTSVLHSTEAALGGTVVACVVGIPAGYGLARGGRIGRLAGLGILAMRMIPGVVLIIPLFVLFQDLHLMDTIPGLVIVYQAFSLPLAVWLARVAFLAVPRELDEAAAIDGASRWRTMSAVVMPAATGGILGMVVLVFIFCWNNFLFSVILTSQNAVTFMPFLSHFILPEGPQFGDIFAGASIFVIPPLIGLVLVRKQLSAAFSAVGDK